MLSFLPENPQRIIDIGCGAGFFGAAVKRKYPNCETWGVEAAAEAARTAALHNDRIVTGLVEEVADLPERYFDAVTMNDVLEHMTWPEPSLAIARRILKPEGKLILSLPNVRYFVNVRDLVFNNSWEYQDRGILDRTHLRFYTTRSAANLLQKNGYVVEAIVGINQPVLSLHYRLLFCLAPNFFHWMRFPQFAIIARLC